MTPEGSSSKTWVIILIIAVILAIAGFWYYSSSRDQASDLLEADNSGPMMDNENGSLLEGGSTGGTTGGLNVGGNASGSVNFNTADDLPAGSTYPDAGK